MADVFEPQPQRSQPGAQGPAGGVGAAAGRRRPRRGPRPTDRHFDVNIEAAERYLQPTDEGLALGGDVALNGRLVMFLSRSLARPVHVPAAPDDVGIGIGAVWAISAPSPVISSTLSPLRRDLGSTAPGRAPKGAAFC
eukprot:EG_transcript_44761